MPGIFLRLLFSEILLSTWNSSEVLVELKIMPLFPQQFSSRNETIVILITGNVNSLWNYMSLQKVRFSIFTLCIKGIIQLQFELNVTKKVVKTPNTADVIK